MSKKQTLDPGPQLSLDTLSLPAGITKEEVEEALSDLKEGFCHARCPDHWSECDYARILASVLVFGLTGVNIVQEEKTDPSPAEPTFKLLNEDYGQETKEGPTS